ncbi:Electron transfer flavoprotein subunit alpha [Methylacidimicrobium cyclopophantes]|uniref:Electron transfer flavoprotein subunit alpha n=1 Tax=Methylacidimicrobium cyclopophantes TaxID=1041766 RepID=A0A5E6MAB4_9BACT|nr:FAD-binding protein [Methylacidimicrobium cyclopophantes]VVM05253.1 Electron transfer flavoprotein subunit alpha [Methylacidimicrobium cyclopophantes]
MFGAEAILLADHPSLEHPLADRYGVLLADLVREEGATLLCAASSTFSRDLLPRAAGPLQVPMLSDVTGAAADGDAFLCRRAIFAGNGVATVQMEGPVCLMTLLPAAFGLPEQKGPESPVRHVALEEAALPRGTEFVGRSVLPAGGRPDATEASIVVSGGRAFRSREEVEKHVGGLADALGGVVGSTRALVDAGITPNPLRIGHTGKNVAPELPLP